MVTIVLDTNVLRPELNLDSAAFEMLRTLAEVQGHAIALPDIVQLEAVELFRRRLDDAWKEYFQAARGLRAFVPWLGPADFDRDVVVAGRASQLSELFAVLAAPIGAAEEALRREARRQAPAKADGTGGRDCVIWLTVCELANSGELTYFVTENSSDFGKKGLRPELFAELSKPDCLIYCDSLAGLLETLATRDETSSVEPLVNDSEVRNTVEQALLQSTFMLAASSLRTNGGFLQGGGLTSLATVGFVRVDSYALGTEHFAIVRAKWESTRTVSVQYTQEARRATQTFRVVTQTPLTLLLEHDGTLVNRASVLSVGAGTLTSLDVTLGGTGGTEASAVEPE